MRLLLLEMHASRLRGVMEINGVQGDRILLKGQHRLSWWKFWKRNGVYVVQASHIHDAVTKSYVDEVCNR